MTTGPAKWSRRLPDWPERLSEYLKQSALLPFEWGRHDCILFGLGGAEVLTGGDFTRDIRGHYSSRAGALRRMRHLYQAKSIETACEAFRASMSVPEIVPLSAQRGDLVLADVPDTALGIVSMNGNDAFFLQERGILRVTLRNCRRAWKVG